MTTFLSLNPARGVLGVLLTLGLVAVLSPGCRDASDPSNLPQGQYGPPQGQYGPPQGQYGQPQGQYGQPQGQYVPPHSAPTSPPNPLAPPCTSDAVCGTHKCNLPAQRCAFPCTGPADCMQGTNCMFGLCAPGLPGAPPRAPGQ